MYGIFPVSFYNCEIKFCFYNYEIQCLLLHWKISTRLGRNNIKKKFFPTIKRGTLHFKISLGKWSLAINDRSNLILHSTYLAKKKVLKVNNFDIA